MLKASLSLAKDATSIPSTIKPNPFKARKEWPPDFAKLNPKQQFRLERRFRRRAKLKYTRPRWNNAVKLTTWVSCSFIFVYGILFMDWKAKEEPFLGIRTWFRKQASSVWTTNSVPSSMSNSKTIHEAMSSKDTKTRT